MPDLKKASFLLDRNLRPRGDHRVAAYSYHSEEDNDDGFVMFSIPESVYDELGRPCEITVTVEPGDTLNG